MSRKYDITNISSAEGLSFVCGKWSPLVKAYTSKNPYRGPLSDGLRKAISDLKLKDIFLFVYTYLRVELIDYDGIVKFAKKLLHYCADIIGDNDSRIRQLIEMIDDPENEQYQQLLNYLIEEYEFVSVNMENALQPWEGLENFKVQKVRAFLPFFKNHLNSKSDIINFYEYYHNIAYFSSMIETEKAAAAKASQSSSPTEEYGKHLGKSHREKFETQMKEIVYGFFEQVLKEKEAQIAAEKSDAE